MMGYKGKRWKVRGPRGGRETARERERVNKSERAAV